LLGCEVPNLTGTLGVWTMARDLSEVRFLTVAEVADMMRVSKMTVYRLVHSGELPAIRFGRSFRVPESAVEAAIDSHIADAG
jgi:excisionase family DNA binding protein